MAFVSKSSALANLIKASRPKLQVTARYALVELTVPKVTVIPTIRGGNGKMISGAKTGTWKNATVFIASLIFGGHFVSQSIGKAHCMEPTPRTPCEKCKKLSKPSKIVPVARFEGNPISDYLFKDSPSDKMSVCFKCFNNATNSSSDDESNDSQTGAGPSRAQEQSADAGTSGTQQQSVDQQLKRLSIIQ